MLHNIKLRKLNNGYTIKWHVETSKDTAGYSEEQYVATREEMIDFIRNLIEDLVKDEV